MRRRGAHGCGSARRLLAGVQAAAAIVGAACTATASEARRAPVSRAEAPARAGDRVPGAVRHAQTHRQAGASCRRRRAAVAPALSGPRVLGSGPRPALSPPRSAC